MDHAAAFPLDLALRTLQRRIFLGGGDGGMSFVIVANIFRECARRPILERVKVMVEEWEFVSVVDASG